MSRETFVPPTINQQPSSNPGAPSGSTQQQSNTSGGGGGGGFNVTGQAPAYDDSRPVKYLCGDCDTEVQLKKGDAIRCKECGYRVLYKQRTDRMVQFEAR